MDKPNIFIIEIPEKVHQLPGITNLLYTYNKFEKSIVIQVDNIIIHAVVGEMAEFLFRKATGFLEEKDEAVIEVDFRLRKTFGLSIEELKVQGKKREFVVPRQIGMWWLKNNTKKSLREIGEVFEKDHATALWAIKTVNNLIETDKEFVEKIIKKFVE